MPANEDPAGRTVPLAIGVALAPRFERRGESIADARAYEAAGCDSLWLAGDADPWLCAAALAIATSRVRLVVPVTADDVAAEASFVRRVATLHGLAGDRMALLAPSAMAQRVRAAAGCPVLCETNAPAKAVGACDGLVVPALPALEPDPQPTACVATWLRSAAELDRATFRALRDRCRRCGAAGVILRETPRLLDLLRNPDRDDDRSDLLLAHG